MTDGGQMLLEIALLAALCWAIDELFGFTRRRIERDGWR